MNIFQPVPFFPKIDSQYHRYLLKEKLQYQEIKALWFFIDKMDHCGIISCNLNSTIIKSLCHELNIQNQYNCRAYVRKLELLGIIKRISTTAFKLNPYICNRLQNVAAPLFYGFSNLKKTDEYVSWKKLDDEETKNFPSLKRRLHNAYYRDNNMSQNLDTQRDTDMTITLLKEEITKQSGQLQKVEKQLDTMTMTMNELVRLIKQDDLPKAKSFLTLIEGGKE
jgi:hypothetical protein